MRAQLGASLATSLWIVAVATWIAPARADNESAAAVVNEGDDQPKKTTTDPNTLIVQGAAQSPTFTQSRQFTTTRFWLLDPGKQAVEVWYSSRVQKDGEKHVTKHLWQLEYMYSPFRGLEVDGIFTDFPERCSTSAS